MVFRGTSTEPAKITPIQVPNVAYPGIFANIVDEIEPVEGTRRLPSARLRECFGPGAASEGGDSWLSAISSASPKEGEERGSMHQNSPFVRLFPHPRLHELLP